MLAAEKGVLNPFLQADMTYDIERINITKEIQIPFKKFVRMENKMIFNSLMKILDYLRPILIVKLIIPSQC